MKKKIFLILIILVIFFSLGSYFVVSESNLSKQIKKFIPNNLKYFLKETIFIIPKLKKDNQYIIEKLKMLDRDVKILRVNNKKMLGLKLSHDFLNPNLSSKNISLAKFLLIGTPHEFSGYQKTNFYEGRYLKSFKNNLIIFDSLKFYTTNISKDIFKIEKLDLRNISTNIKDFDNLRGIRDMKIINDKLYLFAIFEDNSNPIKYNIKILTAKLEINQDNDNFNKLIFQTFLKFDLNSSGYVQSGGRIDSFKKDFIIVSFGDFSTPKWDGLEEDFFSKSNFHGKIISINLNTKQTNILSKGHRNPQGLLYLEDKNIIINTEHGPKGGDEININFLDKIYNFGWPITSYGIRYNGEDPFVKNHENYDKPIKYFTPSIAPSQIIQKHGESSFYIASLKNTSVYEINFSEDFSQILNEKRIFIGERIRDIIEMNDNIFALTLDNSPAIAFFQDSN